MSNIPPHDLESEEALLSSFLIRPGMIADLSTYVVPGDFYKPNHQRICAAMYDMWSRGTHIDAVTVADELRRSGDLDGIGGPSALHGLQNFNAASSMAPRYAETIVEHSRRRRLIRHFSDLAQSAYDLGVNVDEIIGGADPISSDQLIAARGDGVDGLSDMRDFVAHAEDPVNQREWLIPGLMRRMWRMILVGEEGTGKFVFLRQIALHAAAGYDPFDPYNRRIPPIRVLTIDAENPDSTVAHQARIVNANQTIDLVDEAEDRSWIWHREAGVNLRSRRGKAELEAVIREARPDLVIAGPLYKLMKRDPKEDLEQAAMEFADVIDDLRTRYEFAIILEHHMAKSSGGAYRSSDPFGSSVWKRWPELGYAIRGGGSDPMNHDIFDLEKFREDREPANWPYQLQKRTMQTNGVAWQGTWKYGR